MSSLAKTEAQECPDRSPTDEARDFIPFILSAMSERNIGQRKLAILCQISKSRLGLLLHSDPAKRAPISLCEFQRILTALGISIVQAMISFEAGPDHRLFSDERFATSLAMLTEVFKGLPSMLVAALDEIEGIDGTEVRTEWAVPLRKAVVEKLVKEVTAVMARRDVLSQFSSIGL